MSSAGTEPVVGSSRWWANRWLLPATKVVFALLGFSALVTEIVALTERHRFYAGNYFSFFTVESNLLAVVSLLVSSFAVATGTGGRTLQILRGAVTLFMTTTILIFLVLLSGYSSAELTAVPWDNTVLHYIMPIVIIVDWLITPPLGAVRYPNALCWLGFPLSYLVYSLIRGSIVHWYPYPFINPSTHGYLVLIITSVVIASFLAVIAWLLAKLPGWVAALLA